MRSILLLGLAATLGSCAVAPQPVVRSPDGQKRLETLLAGKVVVPSSYCLPSYDSRDMSVIDGRTLAFRSGPGRTYVLQLSGGCESLERPSAAMLTRRYGGMGLCRGDIVQALDTSTRMTIGSCVVERLTAYARPRV